MLLLLATAPSLAATLQVGPSRAYTTVTSALSAAVAGDTIEVDPGTYAETLTLSTNVTVRSTTGSAATFLAPPTPIGMSAGTLQGFTISPSPSTAVQIGNGTPTLRDLVIDAPSSYGVHVTWGTPTIEEVLVDDAGVSGFYLQNGTPVVQRCITRDAASYGFQVNAAGTVRNSLAIGGGQGFYVTRAGATISQIVALDASVSGIGNTVAVTVSNSAFRDNAAVLKCAGADATFSSVVAWDSASSTGCGTAPTVTNADPLFRSWGSGRELWQVDLRPASGSPMLDAGSGTDTDGSAADLGIFGGAAGTWTDTDGDGSPLFFDCDDRDATQTPGAEDLQDARDNDCDGEIDEDVPVDTGDSGDTGDTGDSGDSGDTGDSGDSGDTGDTADTATPYDLDGDGYDSAVDCSEHNLATHPGAPERMDGADNDCDGVVDEGTALGDDDGDGYTELAGDCDDTNRDYNPNATDSLRDGVDDDCDGLADYATAGDADGDGYAAEVDDCNDERPEINPGAADVTNSVDDDCDGLTDDVMLNSDADGDGQAPFDGDCDDTDPGVFRGNVDIADDFIDQDCTGEDRYDQDADGHASPASGGDDCDDLDSTTHPAHAEVCNDDRDNDCDGALDEDCVEEAVAATKTDCACGVGGGLDGLAIMGAGVLAWVRARRTKKDKRALDAQGSSGA